MAKQYLDDKPTGSKLDRQSAETENHGDKAIAADPNAMGPSMKQPYDVQAGHFFDSNGFDQTWNEGQDLNGKDYGKAFGRTDGRFPRNIG